MCGFYREPLVLMAAFHFLSPFVMYQHLGIEILFNDAMNTVWTGDMLEYEINWAISCEKP
jgi:hypothetical protein